MDAYQEQSAVIPVTGQLGAKNHYDVSIPHHSSSGGMCSCTAELQSPEVTAAALPPSLAALPPAHCCNAWRSDVGFVLTRPGQGAQAVSEGRAFCEAGQGNFCSGTTKHVAVLLPAAALSLLSAPWFRRREGVLCRILAAVLNFGKKGLLVGKLPKPTDVVFPPEGIVHKLPCLPSV